MSKTESDSREGVDVRCAADLLQTDFEKLIRLFDRQLAAASSADPATLEQIKEARLAAVRGLELSQQLTRLLQTGA